MVSNSLPRKTDPVLRQRAEETLRQNPRTLESSSRADLQELIHELQVHQIELELQNEELRRVQAELAESRDRYRDLYDCAPVGYLVLNGKNVILEANLTAATMLGVERAQLLKTSLTQFIARHAQDTFYHFRKKLAETQTRQVCRLTMIARQSEFVASLDGIVARGTGDPPTFRITVADISEHARIEDALRASEEKARNLIQYAPSAIYEIDFHSRKFISVNDVVCVWSGYAREELLTMDPLILADEATRTVLLRLLQRVLAGESIESATEVRMIGRDGHERDLLLNIKTFTYQNGIPVSALVIAHDITERKRMEQAMREHAEELRTANQELVRFNRAAVGREWRMIELKQEVNALCAQVGQPPRYSVEFTEDEQ